MQIKFGKFYTKKFTDFKKEINNHNFVLLGPHATYYINRNEKDYHAEMNIISYLLQK